MKKIPGENSKRKPQIGDLVRFDITWCEGLDPEGNVYSHHAVKLMCIGIVTDIDSREAAEQSSELRRTWSRYYITWEGKNLMFFGSEELIEVVEERNER